MVLASEPDLGRKLALGLVINHPPLPPRDSQFPHLQQDEWDNTYFSYSGGMDEHTLHVVKVKVLVARLCLTL